MRARESRISFIRLLFGVGLCFFEVALEFGALFPLIDEGSILGRGGPATGRDGVGGDVLRVVISGEALIDGFIPSGQLCDELSRNLRMLGDDVVLFAAVGCEVVELVVLGVLLFFEEFEVVIDDSKTTGVSEEERAFSRPCFLFKKGEEAGTIYGFQHRGLWQV